MIQPVNNVSFKAFWEKPYDYNTKQQRTITEIRAKLGERTFEDDYMVEPSTKENSVLLYKFDKLKTSPNGQNLSYDKKMYVGTYNQETPFKISDLKESEKLYRGNGNLISSYILLGFGVIAAVLMPFLFRKNACNTPKTQVEQIVKPVADSLDMVKRDTIKFIK